MDHEEDNVKLSLHGQMGSRPLSPCPKPRLILGLVRPPGLPSQRIPHSATSVEQNDQSLQSSPLQVDCVSNPMGITKSSS